VGGDRNLRFFLFGSLGREGRDLGGLFFFRILNPPNLGELKIFIGRGI